MWFNIDPSSGVPIYRQLVDQVKQGVAGGVLRAGDRLPSVRDLALELTINPHTVAKAYQELERDGVIEVPRGRGAFVAASDLAPKPNREYQERILGDTIARLVAEAHRLQFEPDEVVEMLRRRFHSISSRNREEDPRG